MIKYNPSGINKDNNTFGKTFQSQQSQDVEEQQQCDININFRKNINNNNNNNNNTNSINNNKNNNSNSDSTSERFRRMEASKRILQRLCLDTLIILCVSIPILLLYLYGKPYKRGFFCDDETLNHPFKENTVKSWMLYVIGLLLPLSVMFVVEIWQHYKNEKLSNGNSLRRRYILLNYELPYWMSELYKKIGTFGFGVLACQLTTDIAKYSIGRLRPHFFAVCQPIIANSSTCEDAKNFNKYITDFHCSATGYSERILKEARLSFPSGHSSFSFFTMVFLVIYLQSRMTCRNSKLLRHFLQFVFIMMAWYTALSRISDYKHHWSDVMVGSLIGILSALIVTRYVSDMFDSRNDTKSYILSTVTSAQDSATI